jgi:beta-RFAP synthase
MKVIIKSCAPEHVGLGTGTQLALGVAKAVAAACGRSNMDVVDLARAVGRGERSAIGIHGFVHGGFLVDAGKHDSTEVGVLFARREIPDSWRVVVALTADEFAMHGAREAEAFRHLQDETPGSGVGTRLRHIVEDKALPALAARNVNDFGAAIYEFNSLVGDTFAPIQGGRYAGPRVQELVAWVRRQGIPGAGQSSWGPAVFAITGDQDQATDLVQRIRQQFGSAIRDVFVAEAMNHSATIQHFTE